MRLLEDNPALRRCHELAVEFLRRHAVVEHWGHGTIASSDSMSLEVSRHVWNARIDPRRCIFGVGMYTHVLDQWGIIYDQAIVLGQRQVGAAIEAMVRQTATMEVERLAVDTHGYTDFAMALAKLLGFDLCPRLKALREQRLHIPPGLRVPDEIESIVERDMSRRQLNKGWDELIRVVALIEGGWTSAVLALERFGSPARVDPIHKVGTALGKLLRTVFLCDYVTNASFRRALLRILHHGESVHSLQRAIHFGSIAAAHGRRREELVAISGSLTLLTNLAMAWTTHQMQRILDGWANEGQPPIESEVLRHIAPVHFRGINFRGELHFLIARYGQRLMPDLFGRTGRDESS